MQNAVRQFIQDIFSKNNTKITPCKQVLHTSALITVYGSKVRSIGSCGIAPGWNMDGGWGKAVLEVRVAGMVYGYGLL